MNNIDNNLTINRQFLINSLALSKPKLTANLVEEEIPSSTNLSALSERMGKVLNQSSEIAIAGHLRSTIIKEQEDEAGALSHVKADEIDPNLLAKYVNNSVGWPAVHYAINEGREDIASYLLKIYPEQAIQLTPDIPLWERYDSWSDKPDYDYIKEYERGQSALELAVRKGFVFLAEELIQKGADINLNRNEAIGSYKEIIGQPSKLGKFLNIWHHENQVISPLYLAISNQDIPMVKLLLNYQVDTRNIYHKTFVHKLYHDQNHQECFSALKVALTQNQEEIVRILLDYQLSEKGGQEEITPSIIELFKTFEVNKKGQSALYEALSRQDLEAFEILIKYADPNENRHGDESLFKLALKLDNPAYVQLLLDHHFNKNQAFIDSIALGKIEWVSLLLEGVSRETSALQSAIKGHFPEIVKLLVQNGFKDPEGLKVAIDEQQMDIVQLLVLEADRNGPALGWAIRKHNIDVVRLLIDQGFKDPNALKIALEENQPQIATLFI